MVHSSKNNCDFWPVVPLEVNTICVHGDTAGCDALAAKLRAGLEAAGVDVRRPSFP